MRESPPKSYCQVKILLGTRCPGANTISPSVKESEERLQEEKRSRKALQKAAWLVKKKDIAGRKMAKKKVTAVVLGVKEDRMVDDVVDVDDMKDDLLNDDVEEHTFLDDILAEMFKVFKERDLF